MPFKTFTATTLSVADVNDYLMEQANITVTSATRPTGQEGMLIGETDTNRRYIHDGTSFNTEGGFGWVSYTPSWTNLTIGNGTQEARYRYVQGGIRAMGLITWGSTTSISGTVTQAVPNGETALSAGVSLGTGTHFDTSTPRTYSGHTQVLSSATAIQFFHGEAGNAGLVNATNPFTWATGDIMRWDIIVALS